jgi:uncharacterized protein HemY
MTVYNGMTNAVLAVQLIVSIFALFFFLVLGWAILVIVNAAKKVGRMSEKADAWFQQNTAYVNVVPPKDADG